MDIKKLKSSLILLFTATIWGVSFVAQSVGMEHIGPLTFNGARTLIGALVLLPVWAMRRRGAKRSGVQTDRRVFVRAALLCGLFMFLGSSFQQYGLLYTSVGKSGFITAFYIVLVPLLGLFFKQKTGPFLWLSVGIALVGLYLLSITEALSVNLGDILTLLCAFAFAGHIVTVDRLAGTLDSIALSIAQFTVSGALSCIGALLFETVTLSSLLSAWAPVLYAGVFSCGVAYTLQIVGQKGLSSTVASLILSLESCIAVLAGWLFLGQVLTTRELVGCAVMFAAILLAQLPQRGGKAPGN